MFSLVLVYIKKLSIAFVGWCSLFWRCAQGYCQVSCLHSKKHEARFRHNFSCGSDATYNAVWCWAGRYCDYCHL